MNYEEYLIYKKNKNDLLHESIIAINHEFHNIKNLLRNELITVDDKKNFKNTIISICIDTDIDNEILGSFIKFMYNHEVNEPLDELEYIQKQMTFALDQKCDNNED